MEQDTTKLEILQAINKFATRVEENFTEVKQDIKDIKKRVTNLETKVSSIETRVGSLETDTKSIRSQMVTKSYLDDKLSDLHGETIKLTKQTNNKVVSLANHLHNEESLSTNSLKQVIALPPFAV
jgi:predicted  nucleic acid-binding Zn-ribbon protein